MRQKCDPAGKTGRTLMKAAYIERHGGPEVLKYGDMPDPVAKPGEVVVDIVAASVNGADWKVREGKSGQLAHFPYILGRDFSGVVSAVGDGVTDLRAGARRTNGDLHRRGHAEAEGGRDDPDPGRGRRCRCLCHPARKTSRCPRD